jgi:recombination protein RecT
MYRTLSATPIYEGQIVEENPLTGFVFDFTKKTSDKVIGYASYFELLNGFQKTLYSTTEQLKAHGMQYSQTFKKGFGLWKDNFEAMALKTVIKANLSKWGPLSVDMQKAAVTDQAIVNNDDATDITYVDNEPEQIDHESERVVLMIQDAKTMDELKSLEPFVKDGQIDLYTVKMDELKAKK